MLQILKGIASEEKLVELYFDRTDSESFLAGYVVDANEDWTMILEVNRVCQIDSNILLATSRIFRAVTDSWYLNSFNVDPEARIAARRSRFCRAQRDELFEHFKSKGGVMGLQLSYDMDWAAQVVSYDSEVLVYKSIDRAGRSEGNTAILLQDLEEIHFGGRREALIFERLTRAVS